MHVFDYSDIPNDLLTPSVMSAVGAIREHKGRQELFVSAKPDVLSKLSDIAKIQSTDASNRIEGIYTTDKRLRDLVEQRVEPRDRNEQEIAGYRDVLALIHEGHDYIDVEPRVILQLHRNLYRSTGTTFGGCWKDSDNAIAEVDGRGVERVRFRPLPAIAVPDAMESLCRAYNEALRMQAYDPLLLAAVFTFDFICIHPFNDGNGRMSRLLTLLLLYKSGYLVGKYVSIEHEIEQSKETYYETLQMCSPGWHENRNAYAPFVEYMLGCILRAYREFESRVEGVALLGESKPSRIRKVLANSLMPVSKADIAMVCPDISQTTIERALKALLDEGLLEKIGGGRSTAYRWVGPQEG